MRQIQITPASVVELPAWPQVALGDVLQRPYPGGAGGFVWLSFTRSEFETSLPDIQNALIQLTGQPLLDLHVADLLNAQLPSHYDYTSQYDLLVFRRLATSAAPNPPGQAPARQAQPLRNLPKRGGLSVLKRIDTSPVGFAVFDKVLLTVHPADCAVRDAYAAHLLQSVIASGGASIHADARGSPVRLPASPADLMLRIVNQMVDGFLNLRRELTHQLDHWQTELIDPATRFNNWRALLDARQSLHELDEVCEDQRSSIQDWVEALKTWPQSTNAAAQHERELLQVRSRDVLEHIERVVHHVRRLEQNSETAIQIHFSVQGSRTNDIMRTLTALTAIFLPLNLITGFFGMNLEFMPLIHREGAFWWIFTGMVCIALATALFFWRKRYLARSGR